MANYVYSCPGCHSTKDDIGDFGAYFEVYECDQCSHQFCFHCHSSNNGHKCPKCGSSDFSTVGRVSKS